MMRRSVAILLVLSACGGSAVPTTVSTTVPTTEAPTSTVPPITTTTFPATVNQGSVVKSTGYEFNVDDITTNPFTSWWDAGYFFELPYADGYGWGAGDRCGYRGVYGHLIEGGTKIGLDDQFDLDGGAVIGRFFVSRIVGGQDAYIRLNDGFMREGSRHIDGTPDRNASTSPEPGFDECTEPSEAYEPYTGPDQRPVIVYRNGDGEVAEIRDYRNTDVGDEDIIFQLVDADGTDGQVAVTAHDLGNDGLPGVVVYYDALGGGSIEAHLKS